MCEIPISAVSTLKATTVSMDGSTELGAALSTGKGLQSPFVADSAKASVAVTAADGEAAAEPAGDANGDTGKPEQRVDRAPAAAEDRDGVGELEQPVARSKKSILKIQGSGDSNPALRRAVSWHDFEGRDLHTVKEFTPSEHDDDEVLFQPEKKGGACCVIC